MTEAHDDTAADDGRVALGVTLDDFFAYMPTHSYIFAPLGAMWPAISVNARIAPLAGPNGKPMDASAWLDQHKPVEQITWAPGLPKVIHDRLIADGGWIKKKGVRTFNLYRPPTIEPGDVAKVGLWLDHAQKVYPDDAEHIINFLAHRVQRPGEKINHALVLGGKPGVGKDSLIEPVKSAVGPWNFAEVSPKQVLGRFNAFLRSVVLRISEARDLGDIDRIAFHEAMKSYTAAPPDTLRVDEKNLREYSIPNICGPIITTNHKSDGLYLPADDRRHFVGWSPLDQDSFPDGYWSKLWAYYDAGGRQHVAAYLAQRDISAFDPKAPPPKTQAFWDIVNANSDPEEGALADVLDKLSKPPAVTIAMIDAASDLTLADRRNRRQVPSRMEAVGYVPVRNNVSEDGLWRLNGKRQVIYAQKHLSFAEQIHAARALMKSAPAK